MANDRELLISLGVQKAGTSWLAAYLRKHPSFGLPPQKEVHYFDYHDFGLVDYGLNRHKAFLRKERGVISDQSEKDRSRSMRRIRYLKARIAQMKLPEPTYQGYVEFMLQHSGTSPISCDITPENGCLSLGRLTSLAGLPIATKFCLVLRDPVDRAWSGVRMAALKLHRRGAEFEQSCLNIAEKFLNGEDAALARWEDYVSILSNARTAVPADRLFLDYFENFMSQERIDAFCDFMGVPHAKADLDQRQHEGMKMALPAALKAKFAAKLANQYQNIEEAIGPLPERWQMNRAAA